MKTTLVFPPFYLSSLYNLPPLGLISVATELRARGADVEILDQVLALREGELEPSSRLYDDCAKQILRTKPDVVGFSAQCTTYPAFLGIAGRLKRERTDLAVVVGGHNAPFVDVETLRHFPFVDAVVRGEGESIFPELLAALALGGGEPQAFRNALKSVRGVSFRHGRDVVVNPDAELITDLDSIKPADYALAPSLDRYKRACGTTRATAILDVGRGCPHGCVYCSESALWRRKTRTFSIDRLIAEVKRLRGEVGAECLLLSYDQFTADRRFVEDFCGRMIDEGLNDIGWYCISRLDTVDRPLLGLMREAGCESLCYGIDSGSKRTLAYINKRIDESLLFDRVTDTVESGIAPTLSFIIGFPEEELADLDATVTLALRCGVQGNANPLVQTPTVLPGAELHARCADSLVREADSYFALGIEFDQGKRLAEDEARITAFPKLFSSFYNPPGRDVAPRDLARIADVLPLVLNLFPRSMLLATRLLETSPTRLLLAFLGEASETHPEHPAPDARRVFETLPDFLRSRFAAETPIPPVFEEALRYETLGARAAKPEVEPPSGTGPRLKSGVLVARFEHDPPAVFERLKWGAPLGETPDAPVNLVFKHRNGRLTVTRINDFGSDLLTRLDGVSDIAQVSRDLHPRHAAGTDPAWFEDQCRTASIALQDMDLVGV